MRELQPPCPALPNIWFPEDSELRRSQLRGSTLYLHSRLKSVPTLFALRTNIFPEVKSVWLDVQGGHGKRGTLPGCVHKALPSTHTWLCLPCTWVMAHVLHAAHSEGLSANYALDRLIAYILLPCLVLALGSIKGISLPTQLWRDFATKRNDFVRCNALDLPLNFI